MTPRDRKPTGRDRLRAHATASRDTLAARITDAEAALAEAQARADAYRAELDALRAERDGLVTALADDATA